MSNFEAWKLARNQKHPDDQVPDDLFMCTDPAILSVHLSRFVLENSEYYPPKTLPNTVWNFAAHEKHQPRMCQFS